MKHWVCAYCEELGGGVKHAFSKSAYQYKKKGARGLALWAERILHSRIPVLIPTVNTTVQTQIL